MLSSSKSVFPTVISSVGKYVETEDFVVVGVGLCGNVLLGVIENSVTESRVVGKEVVGSDAVISLGVDLSLSVEGSGSAVVVSRVGDLRVVDLRVVDSRGVESGVVDLSVVVSTLMILGVMDS